MHQSILFATQGKEGFILTGCVCVSEHTESNRHSLVHPSKIIAPIYQGGRKGIHSRTHEETGGECVPVIPTVLGWEECIVVGCML